MSARRALEWIRISKAWLVFRYEISDLFSFTINLALYVRAATNFIWSISYILAHSSRVVQIFCGHLCFLSITLWWQSCVEVMCRGHVQRSCVEVVWFGVCTLAHAHPTVPCILLLLHNSEWICCNRFRQLDPASHHNWTHAVVAESTATYYTAIYGHPPNYPEDDLTFVFAKELSLKSTSLCSNWSLQWLVSTVTGLCSRLISAMTGLCGRLISAMTGLCGRLVSAMTGLCSRLISAMTGLCGRLGNAADGFYNRLVSAVDGLCSKRSL